MSPTEAHLQRAAKVVCINTLGEKGKKSKMLWCLPRGSPPVDNGQGSVTDLGSSKGSLLPTQVEDALHVDLRKAVIARTNEVARLYSMYHWQKNVSKREGRD